MGYRKLQIYTQSLELFLKTHQESFKLPKYELYELGSQLRRSSQSIVANIVEGYGKSRYKKPIPHNPNPIRHITHNPHPTPHNP